MLAISLHFHPILSFPLRRQLLPPSLLPLTLTATIHSSDLLSKLAGRQYLCRRTRRKRATLSISFAPTRRLLGMPTFW